MTPSHEEKFCKCAVANNVIRTIIDGDPHCGTCRLPIKAASKSSDWELPLLMLDSLHALAGTGNYPRYRDELIGFIASLIKDAEQRGKDSACDYIEQGMTEHQDGIFVVSKIRLEAARSGNEKV